MRCFFTDEECNGMMRWISLINKLFSDINAKAGRVHLCRVAGNTV